MKKCGKCGETKAPADFYKNRSHKDGLQHWCKTCWKAYGSSEAKKRQVREYRLNSETSAKRRDYHRKWQLATKYGLTLDQFHEMLEAQDFCCAICGAHQLVCHNGLYVDHDHRTKKVRGLLCKECNAGLGHFQDKNELLLKAARYVQRHSTPLRLLTEEK